ncbi:hypothetical protein NC653_019103 [Populus alba x Populus x berolinensis]|uniref:Uncharacterized protein n=1 Tax=Populus alba x Populus x berolinensis TaxID=444605 RepID=A0AAD6QI07_9ROSI|nr:hypothetical protein NC653_019103 [Populus alba x Populus x berolinensis]
MLCSVIENRLYIAMSTKQLSNELGLADQPILVLDAVILSLSNAGVIMGSGSYLVYAVNILNYARMITNVDSSRQCVFGVVNLGLPCKNVWKCFAADLKFIRISSNCILERNLTESSKKEMNFKKWMERISEIRFGIWNLKCWGQSYHLETMSFQEQLHPRYTLDTQLEVSPIYAKESDEILKTREWFVQFSISVENPDQP